MLTLIKTMYVDGDLDKLKRNREALMEKLPVGCSLLADPESVRKKRKLMNLPSIASELCH